MSEHTSHGRVRYHADSALDGGPGIGITLTVADFRKEVRRRAREKGPLA